MRSRIHGDNRSILTVILLLSLAYLSIAGTASDWASLAPGVDYKYVAAKKPSVVGDSRIFVLRIDPNLWHLEAVGISQTGESTGRTAREWAQRRKFSAVINAGMFAADFKTHLGYMGSSAHINDSKINAYQSVAAFDPRDSQSSPFRIFDLDAPGTHFEEIQKNYSSALQNLRLIKRPGSNQWSQQDRKWSEAALGEDEKGRILFIYSRSPFSMHDLNSELLSAGIGIVAAQHLEGGPEAQLYLHLGSTEMELFGSYETNFKENDFNSTAWPIPNVLGVRPRTPPAH